MTNKLPIGWTLKRLGDITERITRKNTINNNNVLTISAEHGFISQDKFFTKIVASKDLSKYILLYKGDFCYNKSYCRGYPYGVFRKLKNYDVGVATSLYIYFKIIEGDSTFFEYLFDVGTLNKQLSIISQEGVRNHGLLNVPIEDFFNMTVPFPPIDEQKRIAEVLSLCDKLIENLTKLIEKKEIYKKGVMQRVLTGEVRFNGFTDEWETMPLCKILEERKTFQPKDGNLEHVSLTKEGVVPKSERYERDFLVKDKNKQYKITKINDICYNPANLKFGVICKNNYGEGIFSPIYVTFEVNKGFNIDFISYILKSESFINNARRYEEGTVYERKAVSPENLLSIKIKIPPSIEEQNKIAELLTLIDKDIEILKRLLHLRKLQKKGVMQKLLTGEVRI